MCFIISKAYNVNVIKYTLEKNVNFTEITLCCLVQN